MFSSKYINALRMERQHLIRPAGEAEYNELFRYMSPVQTEYWCCPGYPPTLAFHSKFNDYNYCFNMRSHRDIIKGRFQGGGVAYVFADELDLFAAAYKKEDKKLSFAENEILELLHTDGPMNIKLIKEITGILVKDISPVLHKLQEKFLVFEDQADNEWDRAWYLFETEFPDVDLNKYSRIHAIKKIILRFAYLNVLFDENNVRSFYRFSAKDIKTAISELKEEKKLITFENGYILGEDETLIKNFCTLPPQSVYALNRNDFFVKSNEHLLKDKYKHDDYDVRYYLLIDGEFKGAVYGFFKFTDVPIEDILLDLPADEAKKRKDEIISAVGKVVNYINCPLKRYNGKEIK